MKDGIPYVAFSRIDWDESHVAEIIDRNGLIVAIPTCYDMHHQKHMGLFSAPYCE